MTTADIDAKAFAAFKREMARQQKEEAAAAAADESEREAFAAWTAERDRVEAEKAAAAAAEIPAQQQRPQEYPFGQTFGMDPGTATPETYRVSRSGVHVLQSFGPQQRWVQITYAPLVITGTFTDPDGRQSVELAWTSRQGGVVRRIVGREAIVRGRELIKTLGGDGLPVLESDSREIERWLAVFEAENSATIPDGYVARYLGWQPDGTFVSSPAGDVRLEVTYEEQTAVVAAHHPAGTLGKWRAGVSQIESYPVPRIAVAAAFAAPLLRILPVGSFTMDISGRSTRGKTTAAQAAYSVWADPSEDARGIASWDTTLAGAERHLNAVRGLVTVLDETTTVKDPKIISDMLYNVPKGQGKLRSGGWQSGLQWQTILLSTGEQSALTYSTHQGTAGRVLSLPGSPFGEGGGPAAVALSRCITDNYGTAGPAYMTHLLELLANPEKAKALKGEHEQLRLQLLGTTEMAGRRAPKVALVALAERVAHRAGILPYEPMPIEQWQQLFTVAEDTDNRHEMAMDVIRSFVAAKSADLYRQSVSKREETPRTGWLGIVPAPTAAPAWVALPPETVRRVLDDAGYKLDQVIEAWLEAGYLERKGTGRGAHLINKKLLGAQARYLVFTPEGVDYRPYALDDTD